MPPLPPDARSFLDAISASPDEPQPRLDFADWLEKRGRFGAAAEARWLAAGHRPAHDPDEPLPWLWLEPSVGSLAFFGGVEHMGKVGYPPGVSLPRPLPGARPARHTPNAFPSREAAEIAILEAWPDDRSVPPS